MTIFANVHEERYYQNTHWTPTAFVEEKELCNDPNGLYLTLDMIHVVREKIIEAIGIFGAERMTTDNLNAHWNKKPIKSSFVHEHAFGWHYDYNTANCLNEAKSIVGGLYWNTFERNMKPDEMKFAYESAICTDEFLMECAKTNDPFNKKEKFIEEFLKLRENHVIVGECVVCGEPVYAYDADLLKDAGTISLSFGYGSRRDTDYGQGFIHDYCSFSFDQKMTGRRLFWGSPLHRDFYALDFEKSTEENWVFDKRGSKNSGDPGRCYRGTLNDLLEAFEDDDEDEDDDE